MLLIINQELVEIQTPYEINNAEERSDDSNRHCSNQDDACDDNLEGNEADCGSLYTAEATAESAEVSVGASDISINKLANGDTSTCEKDAAEGSVVGNIGVISGVLTLDSSADGRDVTHEVLEQTKRFDRLEVEANGGEISYSIRYLIIIIVVVILSYYYYLV